MANWINKILYKPDKEQPNTTTYNIGTTFDKVKKTENSNLTLLDLFTHIQSFFKRPMFMLYSTSNHAPAVYSQIMEWYEITGSDIDSHLTTLMNQL